MAGSRDITADEIRALARECGFEIAGVARAEAAEDFGRYREWVEAGRAGEMRYLTDRRAEVRADPRRLLAEARSIISVGKLYQTPWPLSTDIDDAERGWISRYAWGGDYHTEMRQGLERLEARLRQRAGGAMEAKICVDTAPLLERTYARLAGLGWIGKNTCLIREGMGSWFFLGELLVSLEIEPDGPPPDRCGTCTRCIEACPTQAITAPGVLDARLCISYLTIELRGHWPEELRTPAGAHVFGCDICQDVCPWNWKAPAEAETVFAPRELTGETPERTSCGRGGSTLEAGLAGETPERTSFGRACPTSEAGSAGETPEGTSCGRGGSTLEAGLAGETACPTSEAGSAGETPERTSCGRGGSTLEARLAGETACPTSEEGETPERTACGRGGSRVEAGLAGEAPERTSFGRGGPMLGRPPSMFAPELERLAGLSEAEFRKVFAGTAVTRARYAGFLRNVAIAMGNSGREKFRAALERMAGAEEEVVAEAARWALGKLHG